MTTLPSPSITDYSGATCQPLSGGRIRFTLTPGSSALTITVPNLVPGHRIGAQIRVRADQPGKRIVIRIGDQAYTYGPGPIYVASAENSAMGTELAIDVAGLQTGIIDALTVWDRTDIPANPRPCDVLSLQALYPIQGSAGLRWNTDRWNRQAWTKGAPRPWALEWNRNAWDTRAWNQGESVADQWQDILGPCTDLTVTRGVTTNGPAMSAAVGTLTAHAINALSPRATGLHHGTPIRLIHWPTRTAIYTGVITDLTITPHKPGSRVDYEVTLTASDNVARLASITRYGAKADGGNGSEPWTARLDRLIKSAPELTYRIHDTATQTVPPTVWETSLAKHLDALTASVLGSWTVERDGTVSIRIARPRSAAITLTDADTSAITSGIWSYTDVNVAWASADAVAHVTINNHGAKWDAENSEWTADDTEATVDDPTAATAWGGSAISIDTTLPADAVERTARRYLAAANADPAPSSVSLAAAHDTGPADRGAHMATAATFDPISAINVEWRGEDARALITQVTHTITPSTWKTRLNLTNNQ